jgi:vancomycin permeability regulator SanA
LAPVKEKIISLVLMKRALKYTVLLLVLWFVVHSICIVTDGLSDENDHADIAVILGNKVNEDGTLSARLKARLDKGFELYKDHKVSMLMVSGGTGKEGQPEGAVMAAYLVKLGIPPENIITDNDGNTTYDTAVNFRRLTADSSYHSIVVVSQYYHISRSKLIFRKLGCENVTGAHADIFEARDLYSILREFFGYYSYLLKY